MGEILTAIFGVHMQATVIVHLARPNDEATYSEAMADADIILAQHVEDNYPVPFVRATALLAKYGEKVRVWQNMYFTGYNPELVYLKRKSPSKSRLGGPLGEYHLMSVISAWRDGLDLKGAMDRIQDRHWHEAHFSSVAENSLYELRLREERGGSPVSDLIAEHWTRRRLFYTFNHPAIALLAQYALRIGRGLDLKPIRQVHPAMFGEPLGTLMLPVNPWVHHDYALQFANFSSYRGALVKSIDSGAPFNLNSSVYYSQLELVNSYWRIYDSHPEDLRI
jgi:hypothetical protein